MAEKKQKLLVVIEGDDWVGLYVNGLLQSEGHSLHWPTILRRLGMDVQTYEVHDEWLLEQSGSLPRTLEDVRIK